MDLTTFYEEHIDKVYKFFYVKSLNRHIAEDLTQNTFLIFVESKNNSVDISDNKKYLYGIMRNIWVQFLRDKYQQATLAVENIEDFEDYSNHQVAEFEHKDTHQRIAPLLEKLPSKQREVVSLRILGNLSPKEVAKELGRDKNYVKTTLHRGISNLRKMIDEPFLTIEGEANE